MTRILLLPLVFATLPLPALALPAVGDVLGTDPATATAALEAEGCARPVFEAEDGRIEAKCTDTATGRMAEVYIDPATGKAVKVSVGED